MTNDAHNETHGRDRTLRFTFVLTLLAFLLLAALDVVTTSVVLAEGMGEGNPLVRMLIARGGIAAFAAVKVTSSAGELGIFVLTWLLLPGRWRWLTVAALIGADAWLFVVVGHNVLVAMSAAGLPI